MVSAYILYVVYILLCVYSLHEAETQIKFLSFFTCKENSVFKNFDVLLSKNQAQCKLSYAVNLLLLNPLW